MNGCKNNKAGLQHLTDIIFPSKNKEHIFKEILAKKYNRSIYSRMFSIYSLRLRRYHLNLKMVTIQDTS